MDIVEFLKQKGIELTQQQSAAVTSEGGALLLLAVPGAGKTTALVARVANLIINVGVQPSNILTLTFNRDAAKELSLRWEQLFGELNLAKPHFSTIHSFCYTIIKNYASQRGNPLPELIEGKDGGSRRIIAGLYKELFLQWPTDDLLDELISLLGYAQNMLLGEADILRLDRETEGFAQIRKNYGNFKRQNKLMDFDDMLVYTMRILERNPILREKISQKYTYINIDEAQDTSLLQHKIISLIAKHNIFMVGDEDQSIYGFRGAYPKAMLNFEEKYPDAKILKMERNFRSTPQIVTAAQNFISKSKERFEKQMHTCHQAGQEIKYTVLPNVEGQWEYVAQSLAKLPEGSTAAVLFRQSLSAAPMADVLERRGIPFYSRERRNPLTVEPLVRDVLALLALSRNPGDVSAFRQVYYKLGCYISKETAQWVCGVDCTNIFDEIINYGDENKSTGKISYVRAVISNLKNKSPIKMLEAIAFDIGLIEYFEQRAKGSFVTELYLQKFGVLRAIAKETKTCEEFESRLGSLDDIIANSSLNTRCGVTLSTIHSSKGLEFDKVYIIDAFEGVFPTVSAIENAAAGLESFMEEEARLFYVAATRAKKYLEIICAEQCMGTGLFPSRFINRMQQIEEKTTCVPKGLAVGRRLIHFCFGYGEIIKISQGQASFTVKFVRAGIKVFGFDTLNDTDAIKLM